MPPAETNIHGHSVENDLLPFYSSTSWKRISSLLLRRGNLAQNYTYSATSWLHPPLLPASFSPPGKLSTFLTHTHGLLARVSERNEGTNVCQSDCLAYSTFGSEEFGGGKFCSHSSESKVGWGGRRAILWGVVVCMCEREVRIPGEDLQTAFLRTPKYTGT